MEQTMNSLVGTQLQNFKSKVLPSSKSTKNEEEYKCPICKDKGWAFIKVDGNEFAKPCECGIRDRQIIQSQLQFANIPAKYKDVNFENYRTDIFDGLDRAKVEKAYKAVKWYFDNFEQMQSEGRGLFLYSSCKGSGKTRLALSLANELINKKIPVKFSTSIQILNEIKGSWNNEMDISESKLLQQLIQTPVLIIDDFGTEKTRDWVTEKFYHIINGRYISNKITIFTSNYDLSTIDYDDRITDRISEKCYKIPFPNKSVRQIKSKEINDDFMKQFM